jgi:hypothetical protein
MLYYGMNWRVEFLDEDVKDTLYAMPADIIARFNRIMDMIKATGLSGCGNPTRSTCKGRFGKCG